MRMIFSSVFTGLLVVYWITAGISGSHTLLPDRFKSSDPPRHLLIYFKSMGCTTCAEIDRLFAQPQILDKLEQMYEPVIMNIDETTGNACAKIYGIHTAPSLIITDQQGELLYRNDGALSANTVYDLLNLELKTDGVSAEQRSPRPASDQINLDIKTSLPLKPLDAPSPAVFTQFRSMELGTLASHQTPAHDDECTRDAGRVTERGTDQALHPDTPERNAEAVDNTDVNTWGEPTHATAELSVQESIIQEIPSEATSYATAPAEMDITSLPYSIQLGFFNTESSASERVQQAIAKGLTSLRLEPVPRDSRIFFRVLSGGYATAREARAALAYAQSLGFQAAIRY